MIVIIPLFHKAPFWNSWINTNLSDLWQEISHRENSRQLIFDTLQCKRPQHWIYEKANILDQRDDGLFLVQENILVHVPRIFIVENSETMTKNIQYKANKNYHKNTQLFFFIFALSDQFTKIPLILHENYLQLWILLNEERPHMVHNSRNLHVHDTL